MKYEKPEVRIAAEAIRAIESHTKFLGTPDTMVGNPIHTTPAYEADE
ncbi:MAG TPA: hypothetical protein VN933_02785 [Candidatus Eremiobacteraceae bacterium]|jgi:hypothetical protein|nr:hypothetical protein [Candidatus Eremiobacteraceae bacterium]